MSTKKNLFQLLKPEAKKNLVRNRVKYPHITTKVIQILKKTFYVSDLTGSQIELAYKYTDTSRINKETYENLGFYDTLYCTKIFKSNNEK